jgi:D-alanine transaminase
VLHFQQALDGECQEIVLFNADDEVTEGAVSNVFIVKGGVVITPLLDHQKLPGITRQLVLDILRDHGGIPVEERIVSMAELRIADEIWLTNSAFEIKPVISLDGELIGDGRPGLVWEKVAKLYESKKFEY